VKIAELVIAQMKRKSESRTADSKGTLQEELSEVEVMT
jgi:hypothetical protein